MLYYTNCENFKNPSVGKFEVNVQEQAIKASNGSCIIQKSITIAGAFIKRQG
jgi:hypothetical protein